MPFIILGCLAVVAAKSPFNGFRMSPDDLLEPLVVSETDKEAEEAYRTLFKDAFGYSLEATGKPHVILTELATLTPRAVTCGLKEDDRVYLKGVIKNQYIKFKFALEDQEAVRRQFAFLGTHYNARILQKTLADPTFPARVDSADNPARIDQPLILEALNEFVDQHRLSIRPEDKKQLFQIAVDAFEAKKREGLALLGRLLAFRADPVSTTMAIAHGLITFAQSQREQRADKVNEFMAKRVMNFARVAVALSPVDRAFEHFLAINDALTVFGYTDKDLNIVFSAEIVRKILKTCAYASHLSAKRVGKEVLVSYFAPLRKYQPASDAYVDFITRKYRRSGLKHQIGNLSNEYDRMLRIYAIDVLGTSLSLSHELLQESDLKALFLNFRKLSQIYSYKEQQVFLRLRTMLLQAGPIMKKFPLLFESLYDAILHATQYYTSGYKDLFSRPADAPLLFDDYLDAMWGWKRKLISWVWQWEPNPQDFPINIEENYPFFKLIVLATFPTAFGGKDVSVSRKKFSFAAFDYQNNYSIHQYTVQPAPRRLLNYIKSRFFPKDKEAFNYRHLAGLVLDADAMKAAADYVAAQ